MALFVLGLLFTGFLAGWGAHAAIFRVHEPAAKDNSEAVDYARLDFLKGDWESRDLNDKFRINITWDPFNKEFVGKMTRLGNKTAAAGFQVGETVWKGEPKSDHTFEEWSKAQDTPQSSRWEVRTVDINQSPNDHNHFVGDSDFMRAPPGP
jgi:hypothetical protein